MLELESEQKQGERQGGRLIDREREGEREKDRQRGTGSGVDIDSIQRGMSEDLDRKRWEQMMAI